MTRQELIETLVEALQRSKKRPYQMQNRAWKHQMLRKHGGATKSRALRDMILAGKDRANMTRTDWYDPLDSDGSRHRQMSTMLGHPERYGVSGVKATVYKNILKHGVDDSSYAQRPRLPK
jgi:hypothetical protein